MDPQDARAIPAQLPHTEWRAGGCWWAVAFREWATAVLARGEPARAGLAGWVRNLYDGRVEVVLQGAPEVVSEIERWCSHGPQMATVTSVDASDETPDAQSGFDIR